MKQSLGERIASLRKDAGMSQEKLAGLLGVSRQAVTKWENNISSPSTSNLLQLAKIFGVDINTLSENETTSEITPGKAPWIFIGISLFTIVIYLVMAFPQISIGTVILMVIMTLPFQLFLHLYFMNAFHTNSFTGIAGFDPSIAYNYDAVKKMLIQIDLFQSMMTSFYVVLLCIINLCTSLTWLNILVLFLFVVDFIVFILFTNYRMIPQLYLRTEDQKRAFRSIPLTCIYLITMLAGIGITVLTFALKHLENNTLPALLVSFWLLAGILLSTIAYMMESHRISVWNTSGEYHFSRRYILLTLCSILLFSLIYFL